MTIRVLSNAVQVPLSRLRPHPENDNKQSKFMFGKLLEGIRQNGFAEPITVRSGDADGVFKDGTLEVLGGEHRMKAAGKLGMKKVPINDLGCVDDLTARKLIISLNKVRGESDDDLLSALIKHIADDGGTDALASIPIDEEQLADLLDGESAELEIGDDGSGEPEDDVQERTPSPHKASAKDLSVILGMSGMDRSALAEFLEATRQWASGLPDQERPAYVDLQALLRRNTKAVRAPRGE